MRFIIPGILILVSIAVFFVFAVPTYTALSAFRTEAASYDEALGNSKALENERDKLTAKYNALNRDDLAKLEKLLPENVDNIRLILEIEQLASPYGMAIRDVKYNTDADAAAQSGTVGQGGTRPQAKKNYGTLELEFKTVGTYANFRKFVRDLENNLRIVDISSITFASDATRPDSLDAYEYTIKIRTYWLKN